MIPIVIKGHERPITQLRYNADGEILVSTGRDRVVSIWLSKSGERLGTLGPHGGSVMSVDIDKDTRFVVTTSSDLFVHFWDIKTGKEVFKLEFRSILRFIQISPLSTPEHTKALIVQGQQYGQKSCIFIYDFDTSDLQNIKATELKRIEKPSESPFTKAVWSYDGKHIIATYQDGAISRIDSETGEGLLTKQVHKGEIVDIQANDDHSYFVTASRDSTASLMEMDGNFEDLRISYRGDVPLNTAAVAPVKDIVIAGGGIAAREVTTSAGGKFEAHVFHKIFGDDLGRVGGHFGPINTITFHPHGTGYASGSEDGYVRIHAFDKNYFDFDYGKTIV